MWSACNADTLMKRAQFDFVRSTPKIEDILIRRNLWKRQMRTAVFAVRLFGPMVLSVPVFITAKQGKDLEGHCVGFQLWPVLIFIRINFHSWIPRFSFFFFFWRRCSKNLACSSSTSHQLMSLNVMEILLLKTCLELIHRLFSSCKQTWRTILQIF